MNPWIHDIDSVTVLWGQTIIYTAYCLAILSLMGWFALKLSGHDSRFVPGPRTFYLWVGFLTLLGVSLHLITYNTIPWVKDDLSGNPNVAAAFDLSIGNHAWQVPGGQLDVPCQKLVRFSVTSDDLTYGFGIFRKDNSMVTQMQVVPGHPNDLLWTFTQDGLYDIRSTEYSGPAGYRIIAKDAIAVSGCGK
ncbi:MAG: cytochrome C oxidase subunit II [Propionibacteriaceae bacterium]|jgi:cytochrome c oxidase subunit 2|nr:cytochrome C oxidase subunit II [Propionibacteriaceae bacterium]